MHNYKELEIWKLGVKFCPKIYLTTNTFPKEEKFGLVSQLNRAVVSVPSNIAEGSGRFTKKDFASFLQISLGSAQEVEYLILLFSFFYQCILWCIHLYKLLFYSHF
mgnify:CR=1 FL=1